MFGNTKFLIGVAVVLIIIAAGLGVAIIKSNTDKELTSTFTDGLTSASPHANINLADYEKKALEIPGQDATAEQRAAHADIVTQISRQEAILDIPSCEPNPLSLKVTMGDSISINNPDTVSRTISFDPDTTFTIPASGQIKVSVNFKHGAGIYGYSCDGSEKPVGIFFVQ